MKIKLLSEEFDIEMVNSHDIQELSGMIDYIQGKIYVDKDANPFRRVITAMHEIIHWINARFNIWDNSIISDQDEEQLVDRLATVLVAILPEINKALEYVKKYKE